MVTTGIPTQVVAPAALQVEAPVQPAAPDLLARRVRAAALDLLARRVLPAAPELLARRVLPAAPELLARRVQLAPLDLQDRAALPAARVAAAQSLVLLAQSTQSALHGDVVVLQSLSFQPVALDLLVQADLLVAPAPAALRDPAVLL